MPFLSKIQNQGEFESTANIPYQLAEDRCNWGAIFCGVFTTLAVGVVLLFLANSFGISPIHLVESESSTSLQVGSWLFMFFSWLIAFVAGGNLCSRVGAFKERRRAAFHGFITWAVSGVLWVLIGAEDSLLFRVILAGEGPKSVHWLMFLTGFFGSLGAVMGSSLKRTFLS